MNLPLLLPGAAVQSDFLSAHDFSTSACNMITLTVEQYRLKRTKPQSSSYNPGNAWAPAAELIPWLGLISSWDQELLFEDGRASRDPENGLQRRREGQEGKEARLSGSQSQSPLLASSHWKGLLLNLAFDGVGRRGFCLPVSSPGENSGRFVICG